MNQRRIVSFLVMIAGLIAVSAAAPGVLAADDIVKHDSWWLPPNASLEGEKIDTLFNVIFVVTGVVFLAVEGLLIYFLIKYRQRAGDKRKATFVHGHHRAEVIWTISPAIVLVVMGILSIRVWGQIRMVRPDPRIEKVVEVEVLAQQFQWNVRYPGEDGKFGTRDDMGTFDPNDQEKTPLPVGEIHVPVNTKVLVHLRSKDVLHSFFLPNMRIKMDVVPGLHGQLWFTPTQPGHYELACAELCGPQHYTMKGDLFVHTQEDYDAWLKPQQDAIRTAMGTAEGGQGAAASQPESTTEPAATTEPAVTSEPATATAPAAEKK